MKKLIKLNVILIVFTMIFTSGTLAGDKILPMAKPSVDEETKVKTAKKKIIYPKKNLKIKKLQKLKMM